MKVKTAIVMMNLGGPKDLEEVAPFLLELFNDREIIKLPVQDFLGPFIAKRRVKAVQKNYSDIGGGSPILDWTNKQGQGMVEILDQISPETAPHKFYVAFRYAKPNSQDALKAMQADGVERAIAFTQYPQYSCATTGSSLNELWRAAKRLGLEDKFAWSIIDRWGSDTGFIEAMTETVEQGLELFESKKPLILFSAHSLPLEIIKRGDPYPAEIGASVHEVMKQLDYKYQYILSYQSEVGPVPWQGPSTESVIEKLAEQGHNDVLVVPIAFTSDHIETLHELDIEYAELAHKKGISNFKRAPAMNASDSFINAIAKIVNKHIKSNELYSQQYKLKCPGCTNEQCRQIINPFR